MSLVEPGATDDATYPARQRPGFFFFDLPYEIRIMVYELALLTLADLQQRAVPLATEPPSKSLLSTCKRIAQEFRWPYRNAYRRFFSNTHFRVERSEQHTAGILLQDLKTEDVAAISRITIADCGRGNLLTEVEFSAGVWTYIVAGQPQLNKAYIMPTGSPRQEPGDLWTPASFLVHDCRLNCRVIHHHTWPLTVWIGAQLFRAICVGGITDPEEIKRVRDVWGRKLLHKMDLLIWLAWSLYDVPFPTTADPQRMLDGLNGLNLIGQAARRRTSQVRAWRDALGH